MKFSLVDIITHDFMGAFIYMNTGHFRMNAKAKSKKFSTLFLLETSCFDIFHFSQNYLAFVQLYEYKTKEIPLP